MSSFEQDNDGIRDGDSTTVPPPISRTPSRHARLEAEILRSELAPARDSPRAAGEGSDPNGQRIVLVVVADAALRRYVHECLRYTARFFVHDVTTPREAIEFAARLEPGVMVVDRVAEEVVRVLVDVRVIVIDDGLREVNNELSDRRAVLMSPFTAETLVAEIDRLLAT